MAAEENPANAPITARAPKNHQTLVASPISAVNTAIAKLERSSDSFRPCLSATRPQIGEANAATNDVEPVMTPDQRSTPSVLVTPSCGNISGMIGLRKLIAAVMTNWMPTIAHRVRCQPVSASRPSLISGLVLARVVFRHFPHPPGCYRNGGGWKVRFGNGRESLGLRHPSQPRGPAWP